MNYEDSSNSASRRALLQQQQTRLFRHLSGILCQLCERIEWSDLENGERRRLRRFIAGLASELHAAQSALSSDRRAANRRVPSCHIPISRRNRATTKAAFRKR